ncbi:MAG TPA: uracil-DNA glycosylase [Methylophilaceae bacterium]|jgi:uracil-DNA glycosylase family 4
MNPYFDLDCRRCARLANFLDDVKAKNPDYHARPVAQFGVQSPKLLIVGLAPGMHGANRTGRPFTGDHAGILLYQTLHKFGFATAPESVSRDDGLELIDCRITNAVKCLPPDNKPETAEVVACNGFLAAELASLDKGTTVLALGNVAHGAVLRALKLKAKDFPFIHAARYVLPSGLSLHDSYHCSRYNTNTRRLTQSMFEAVFSNIKEDLSCPM